MLRDCFIFLMIMAGLLLGSALIGVGSFRNPRTWIISVCGAAIWEVLAYMVYKSKPRKNSSE